MSPHEYLVHIRIKRAKALLAQHSPLLDVALETGFVDQSHLTKHFKRRVGVTPGRYAHRPEGKNVQDRDLSSRYTSGNYKNIQ
jgi:AraC-like DNA-binding protein